MHNYPVVKKIPLDFPGLEYDVGGLLLRRVNGLPEGVNYVDLLVGRVRVVKGRFGGKQRVREFRVFRHLVDNVDRTLERFQPIARVYALYVFDCLETPTKY